MSELSREQFVAQLLEHVKVKFPLVKIAEGEQPFSLRVNGQLAGLENIYRTVILRPNEQMHHIDRWVVELLRAAEGTPDRTGSFEDVKERILPMVLAGSTAEAYKGTVTSTLVEGLIVAYAIDQDRTISYIPHERFDDWKIDLEQLHELAINNLIARSETLAAHAAEDENGEVNLILFQTMDGYDASRILLPTLHDASALTSAAPLAPRSPTATFFSASATIPKRWPGLERRSPKTTAKCPTRSLTSFCSSHRMALLFGNSTYRQNPELLFQY